MVNYVWYFTRKCLKMHRIIYEMLLFANYFTYICKLTYDIRIKYQLDLHIFLYIIWHIVNINICVDIYLTSIYYNTYDLSEPIETLRHPSRWLYVTWVFVRVLISMIYWHPVTLLLAYQLTTNISLFEGVNKQRSLPVRVQFAHNGKEITYARIKVTTIIRICPATANKWYPSAMWEKDVYASYIYRIRYAVIRTIIWR